MRVVKISPLKKLVTVVPENTLDLLNLFRVLQEGDMVYALTSRELKKERRDGSVDSERVTVELGVEIHSKKLDPMMKRLTLSGVIRYESRDLGLVGKHHSVHLSVGDELTVESRKNYSRLEAMASYYRGQTLRKPATVVLVDDEGVTIYDAGPNGLKQAYRKNVTAGKEEPESREKELSKIFDEAVERLKEAETVYVFGPSIMVDELLNHVKRRGNGLSAKLVKTGYVSSTGEGGLLELMRNKGLHELREQVKAIADTEEVEELLEHLAKYPSTVALGMNEITTAFKMGAIKKILFAEDFLWSRLDDYEVVGMLDKAEDFGVDVRVVSSGSEASEKLLGLGGVAALLRYPIDPNLLRMSN